MRRALRLAALPLFLTLVLAVVLITAPGRTSLAIHIWVLVLAAVGLGRLHAAVRAVLPPRRRSPFDIALRAGPRPTRRIPELERMEREVALGLTTAFDLHFRLRPHLRHVAAELLAARRGIELDANPEAARRALGGEVWELVRPDREPPRERFAAGLDLASLRHAVTTLEAL